MDTDTDVEEVVESDPFQGITTYPCEKEKAKKCLKKVTVKMECDDCGFIFKSKTKMQVHWNKEHLPQKLTCSHCKRVLKSYKAFKNHIENRATRCIDTDRVYVEGEGKTRKFFCKECTFSTPKIQPITTHLHIHTGQRPHKCKICDKAYTQMGGLQAHMEYRHQQGVREITCEQCGIVLKGRYTWAKHMRVHRTDKFPCPICHRLYASKYVLKWHMQRHSGIKNYACDICAKTFSVSSDLRTHKVKVHFNSKNQMFSCIQCEYKPCNCNLVQPNYTAYNMVYGHHTLENQQPDIKNKQYRKNLHCSFCDKTFYSKKSMASHGCNKNNLNNTKNENREISQTL